MSIQPRKTWYDNQSITLGISDLHARSLTLKNLPASTRQEHSHTSGEIPADRNCAANRSAAAFLFCPQALLFH